FARNSKSAARLAEQFHLHQVEKIYWAIVGGQLDPPEQNWVDWLLKLPEEARAEVVPPRTTGAKKAVLNVTTLFAAKDDLSWVEMRPRTGRMHQLRIQAAVRGHPILGDELYGSTIPFGPPAELSRDRVIALH